MGAARWEKAKHGEPGAKTDSGAEPGRYSLFGITKTVFITGENYSQTTCMNSTRKSAGLDAKHCRFYDELEIHMRINYRDV